MPFVPAFHKQTLPRFDLVVAFIGHGRNQVGAGLPALPGKGQNMKTGKSVKTVSTAKRSTTPTPRPADLMLVREFDKGQSLWIDDKDRLTLRLPGKPPKAVSVSEALAWWLPTIEEHGNSGADVSGDPRGEWQFFALLSRGLFVPLNVGELAAVRLCARDNTNGDLAEWAKGWIAGGIEADLEDVCPHCKESTKPQP
jgi:hypothetical protein